jgi:hypothetical protein
MGNEFKKNTLNEIVEVNQGISEQFTPVFLSFFSKRDEFIKLT